MRCREPRDRERRDRHSERLRHLPDAHRKAPLVLGKPADDDPAAGRIGACGRHPAEQQKRADEHVRMPDSAAPAAPAAVPVRPATSTRRSPTRSTTAPQAISVSTKPSVGIATRTPAAARLRWRWSCNSGMRKAAPVGEQRARRLRRPC